MSYALITGASDRIGKSMAFTLAHLGYDIILHYNSSKKKAEETQNLIKSIGRECLVIQADFRDEKQVKQLVLDFPNGKPIEILINNASDFVMSNVFNEGYDLLDTLYKINFKAPYILTKTFAKTYNEGLIINILDTKIAKNQTKHLDYLLTKKNLEAFTQISALQLAPTIRVNGISPGLILPPKGKTKIYVNKLAKDIPLKTTGTLENINETLKFFIKNKFITGQIIYVDGGEHLLK